MILLRFFKGQAAEPDDGYTIHETSGAIGVVSHNWLQMHPNGRVEITTSTIATTVPAPAPRSVEDMLARARELAAPARA